MFCRALQGASVSLYAGPQLAAVPAFLSELSLLTAGYPHLLQSGAKQREVRPVVPKAGGWGQLRHTVPGIWFMRSLRRISSPPNGLPQGLQWGLRFPLFFPKAVLSPAPTFSRLLFWMFSCNVQALPLYSEEVSHCFMEQGRQSGTQPARLLLPQADPVSQPRQG